MVIEESDFRLIPVNETSSMVDLELLYTVNKGKANERTEFRNAGYGMSLDRAIRNVVMYRVNNKHDNDSIDLKTFLKEFKEEVAKIEQICGI